MAGNSSEPGRTVTSKLAAILVAFTNGRDYTLSELAMQTNLAVSTVHRLLSDLVRTSLLERPDGCTYRPGPDAPRAALRGRSRRRCASGRRSSWRTWRSSLHTTARLGVVDGLEVAYVEKKARARTRHAVPQPGQAAPARHGHGQGAARLRVTLAGPGPRRWRPPAVHRRGPSSARSTLERDLQSDQGPRLRPRGQRAPAGVPVPSPYPCSTSTEGRSPPSRWT